MPAERIRHNHAALELAPLTGPACPLCPRYLDPDGTPIRKPYSDGTTADRLADGAAADEAARGC